MNDVTFSTLRAKHTTEPVLWFVMRRETQDWTTAAKVVAICTSEDQAGTECLVMQHNYPAMHFAVTELKSMAREKPTRFELVKAGC